MRQRRILLQTESVFRGLLLDDDAEGGAVMGFGGFDEDAFLSTTKVESMV